MEIDNEYAVQLIRAMHENVDMRDIKLIAEIDMKV